MVEPAHAVHASSAHASTAEGQEALADASPQVAELQRLQALADGGPPGTLQCKTPEEEELLQGCFRTVQRQSPEEEELLQGKFATTPPTPAPNRTGIHLAPGQDRHLPHEAWHLVQQAQGRLQPTLQLNGGVAVNDDPSLEREADQMGERALAGGS